MRKTNHLSFLFLIAGIMLINLAKAQISQGGTPPSIIFKAESAENVDIVRIPAPDLNALQTEDAMMQDKAGFYRVAELIPVHYGLSNSGSWTDMPDGSRIWRLKIIADDARALSLHYEEFALAPGSRLFIYNEDRSQIIGAFTDFNNSNGGFFATELIQGESCTLEYVEPAGFNGNSVIKIYAVGYAYRGVDHLFRNIKQTGWGGSESCQVNVNCSPEGDDWQDEKRGVAEIFVIDGFSAGFCSGSLINNTNQDCTPYFLSADHCGGSVPATDMDQWEFYFNYEAASCTTPGTEPSYNTIVGATLVARGDQYTGSDFLLMELNQAIPDNYNVYYNGWDISGVASTSGVGIHHPSGDIKKISHYTSALTNGTWQPGQSITNGHWTVTWTATANGTGVTEGGSSGSPIFDATGLVVGTLTGGSSYCTAVTSPDLYGKMDVHWDHTQNGTVAGNRLRDHLDPTNSGVTTLNGKNSPCGAAASVTADFSGTPLSIIEGQTVDFTDLSTGSPTSWSWTFPGSIQGTSTAQSPAGIQYNTAGTYDVTLTASNATSSDTETKAGYVVVGATTVLTADFTASVTVIPAGGTVNFTDQSTGSPTSWNWAFQGGTPSTSSSQNPSNIAYATPGVYNVTLTVGNGTDTDSEIKTGYIIVTGITTLDAEFIANQTSIMPGTAINFTDLSTGGTVVTWTWAFDGGTPSSSSLANPTGIVYSTPGTYDVTLTISDGLDIDAEVKTGYITVQSPGYLNADFVANQTVVTTDQSVTFTNLSVGAITNYAWTFTSGNPNNSTVQNPPVVNWSTPGTYDVRLIVTDTAGVKDTMFKPAYITVLDPVIPTADFTGFPLIITPGDFVEFTDLSTDAPTTWKWKFFSGTPGTSSIQQPPVITYNAVGLYDVQLIVSNSAGADTILKEDYVQVIDPSLPTADFIADNTIIFVGDTVIFTDLSGNNPDTWQWDFSGGTPASAATQDPGIIVYNTVGIYDVSLIATNANGSDTELKADYIHVFDLDSIAANFVASPTTIFEGDSVLFTDLSLGDPVNYSWYFEGGAPATSTDQDPGYVTYLTAGFYDVKLVVTKGQQIDSLTLYDYIEVIQTGVHPPQADFYTPFTTITPGTSIVFYDLSIDGPEDWFWIFEGANPGVGTTQNPVNITYNDTGYYDVTLIVTNAAGVDTLTKEDYIHVIELDSITDPPIVDFVASQRLIPAGTTIYFTDLTENNPTAWKWSIETTPDNFDIYTVQNPSGITYTTPGLYNVTLQVANMYGTDSLTKTQYIVVSDTAWASPEGYCDTITNHVGWSYTYYDLEYTWGYFPGHNGDKVRAYADRFVNYTFSEISAIIVPVEITVPGATDAYVRFKIWDGDDYPVNEITSKKVLLSDLYPKTFCYIEFDSIIPIDGIFFAGVEIRYDDAAQDTFVVSMQPDRGPSGENSLYMRRSTSWFTPHEYYMFYGDEDVDVNTALGIKLVGCLVGIEETESSMDSEILVYPNPTNDEVNINLGSITYFDAEIQVLDMMGRIIPVNAVSDAYNQFRFSVADLPSGIYFLNIRLDNEVETRMISVIK